MVDQAEQQMLLVEISACLNDYEGTNYIPLEQQDHNWVLDHAKYNICHECVYVYDNDYT